MFSTPSRILSATSPRELPALLEEIDSASSRGFHAAGFIAYEAAAAFDSAFPPVSDPAFPLAWFAIYERPPQPFIPEVGNFPLPCPLIPDCGFNSYAAKIRNILEHISRGDIYQANLTIRLHAPHPGHSPLDIFNSLIQTHPVPYPAFIDTGNARIVSISPELFLERLGRRVSSSPMKGTAARHSEADDDEHAAASLARDPKNRAENLMIVDMVRNDLGRVCVPGSISVDPLFQVRSFNTVHQMISTVHGTLPEDCSLFELMRAAFPPASITGAPKIRAAGIIAANEDSPRKIYTGSIGCVMPGGDCCFNVAIRTMLFDDQRVELGVGGGIVADSTAPDEWREAMLKSRFALGTPQVPQDFLILETLLHRQDGGLAMLEQHLARARNSQKHFKRQWDESRVRAHLAALRFETPSSRVRLTISPDGSPHTEIIPLSHPGWKTQVAKIRVASERVNSANPLLRHKTTARELYDRHYQVGLSDGYDECLFLNERGEVTEGCVSNVFLLLDQQWLTPHIDCGLLPGIYREHLIGELQAREYILTSEDLHRAQRIVLCNSVRGQTDAVLSP